MGGKKKGGKKGKATVATPTAAATATIPASPKADEKPVVKVEE